MSGARSVGSVSSTIRELVPSRCMKSLQQRDSALSQMLVTRSEVGLSRQVGNVLDVSVVALALRRSAINYCC